LKVKGCEMKDLSYPNPPPRGRECKVESSKLKAPKGGSVMFKVESSKLKALSRGEIYFYQRPLKYAARLSISWSVSGAAIGDIKGSERDPSRKAFICFTR